METLVDRLQKALSAKKLSWSKASTMIGLSPQAPSKWKKGHISRETLEKLAGILEVDVGWLMTGGEPISAQAEKTQPVITQEYGNVKPTGKTLREIPVLDFVQAGCWRDVVYDGLHPKGITYTSYEGID